MPDWVIRSKLKPPVRLRNLVSRDRLYERLEESFDARLALVHAPAGYGKSTCLAQWRNMLIERSIPVAWLSFDEHDADLFQFLTYLIESCIEAGFAAGRDFPRISEEYSVLAGSEVSTAIATGFSKCNGPHVLILDDFHRAQSDAVLQCVNYLLGASPANIHIVISTRELPSSLQLADLRIHDELVEVSQDDLRFSADEIRTYLDYWVDTPSTDDWPLELHERTEGWAVALQTVRRWVSDGTTIEETLSQLSGRTSDLADYFLEQVFHSLSDDVREFLLITSILERVNGDLGSALHTGVDSWEILQSLDYKDIFVQSLDRQRTWYRYHRLFSEFLQERLRRSNPERVPELHLKAAKWFREHGHTTEAIQHAIASGDLVFCAELLEEQGGWHYALRGHVSTVQSILAKLDSAELQRYPRLWIAKIYLAIRLGKMDEGEREIARFEETFVPGESADAELTAEARVMQATIRVYGDKPISDEVVAELEDLGDSISAENNALHAARNNLLCAIYRDIGRFDECMSIGDQAISHYRAMGSLYGETFIYFHEGLACLRQGRLRDAESLYKEGYGIAVDMFGESSDLAAIGRAYLAEVSYEKNRLHEAKHYLQNSIRHIEKADAWLDVYLAAYLTRMKLARALGDAGDVDRTVTRAKSTAINRGLDRLGRIIDLQRRELALVDSEETVHKPLRGQVPDYPDEVSRQFVVRIEARELLVAGEFERATVFLEREAKAAKNARQIHCFVRLTVLLSAAKWLNGQTEAAIVDFESALTASIFEGNKRPFIDEGELVSGVIHEVSRTIENRSGNRLRDSFIAELVAEIDVIDKDQKEGDQLLSPREREVLRFVMQGQSNRETAEAMGLSVNTVKFHLKNVFEKLGVSSRKDAVQIAIREHLV